MSFQVAQLAHILDGRLKELSEDADWEKAAREAAAKTAQDKTKAAKNAEKRVVAVEKARALAEGSSQRWRFTWEVPSSSWRRLRV